MGSENLNFYNRVIGQQNLAPAGSPPLSTARETAQKRLDDAKAKDKEARQRGMETAEKLWETWDHAVKGVPADDQQNYWEFGERYEKARMDLETEEKRFASNPTAENQPYLDHAKQELVRTEEEFKRSREMLIDYFKPADRAAWEAAKAAREQAEKDEAAAESELHAAENSLEGINKAAAN
jgi:hypothetical protein